MKSADLRTWDFEFILVCPEKLGSPSSVLVQNLTEIIQSNFFGHCLLSSSFSVALAVKWRVDFVPFISSVHLSESVHALLGVEIRIQF